MKKPRDGAARRLPAKIFHSPFLNFEKASPGAHETANVTSRRLVGDLLIGLFKSAFLRNSALQKRILHDAYLDYAAIPVDDNIRKVHVRRRYGEQRRTKHDAQCGPSHAFS